MCFAKWTFCCHATTRRYQVTGSLGEVWFDDYTHQALIEDIGAGNPADLLIINPEARGVAVDGSGNCYTLGLQLGIILTQFIDRGGGISGTGFGGGFGGGGPPNAQHAIYSYRGVDGGTFTLKVLDSLTTAPIAFPATAAAVQTALDAILGVGRVSVTGGPLSYSVPIFIHWIGIYAGQVITPPQVDCTFLTTRATFKQYDPGGDVTSTISLVDDSYGSPTDGRAVAVDASGNTYWGVTSNGVWTVWQLVDGGVFPAQPPSEYYLEVSHYGQAQSATGTFRLYTQNLTVGGGLSYFTSAISTSANAAAVKAALEANTDIGAGNVSVTGGPLPTNNMRIKFQGARLHHRMLVQLDESGLLGFGNLQKRDSTGAILWTTSHYSGLSGAGGVRGAVEGIAVDASGNVYTAGQASNWLVANAGSTNNIMLTTPARNYLSAVSVNEGESNTLRKYNSAGVFQWGQQPITFARAVAVDPVSGNVCVVGDRWSVEIGFPRPHLTTAMYDQNGTLLWYTDHNNDLFAVAIDGSGNVYTAGRPGVAGASYDPFTGDVLGGSGAFTIRKYNSAGVEQTGGANLWPLGQNGAAVYAIACDAAGNVYTGGDADSRGMTTNKYDSLGNLLCSSNHGASVNSVAVAADGSNLYTAGTRT